MKEIEAKCREMAEWILAREPGEHADDDERELTRAILGEINWFFAMPRAIARQGS